MLEIPEIGINRSIIKHNSNLDVFCDWVEASILFIDDEISRSDIIDILIEGQIYNNQDFASEFLDGVWSELRKRKNLIGKGSPYNLSSNRISRVHNWDSSIAHSFCIILSLFAWYKNWSKKFGNDYTTQGELFEFLTKESLEQQFTGWIIHHTGWSSSSKRKLEEIVKDVASMLSEKIGDIKHWSNPKANEAGLDLVFYWQFKDNRVGIPVFLIQCASGSDWIDKLKTPDLALWKKIILFASPPTKAFSLPFALLDDVFIKKCVLVEGMLLDRYRILAPSSKKVNWISDDLSKKILSWMKPKIKMLPKL